MANTDIDIAITESIDGVTDSSTATTTANSGVRVIIENGLTKEQAYVSLTNIRDALISDRITLE